TPVTTEPIPIAISTMPAAMPAYLKTFEVMTGLQTWGRRRRSVEHRERRPRSGAGEGRRAEAQGEASFHRTPVPAARRVVGGGSRPARTAANSRCRPAAAG